MADSCGADLKANELLTSLLAGKDFTVPDVNLDGDEFVIPDFNDGMWEPLPRLKNEDLTTRVVDGTGIFDAIMSSVNAHLLVQFEKNRITGNDYTKAYIELTTAGISSGVQFLLQRDSAYWQSVLAQSQAKLAETAIVKARVDLEVAKVQLAIAQFQGLNAEAEFGLTKMKLATEDAAYCIALQQKAMLIEQIEGVGTDNDIKTYNLNTMLPKQNLLLTEQIEVQRAQTLDTRTDGATIVGAVGKQKALYDQQITSYKRDAENKVAKIYSDAFITQKTLDEGLVPPSEFTSANINAVMLDLKNNVDLG